MSGVRAHEISTGHDEAIKRQEEDMEALARVVSAITTEPRQSDEIKR
jgi:hypothetical protein